jgi:hypothetical protein
MIEPLSTRRFIPVRPKGALSRLNRGNSRAGVLKAEPGFSTPKPRGTADGASESELLLSCGN